MNDSESADLEIIERIQNGDIDAFESLIKRHQSYVFAIVGKHIPAEAVEEVAHETFVRAYQSLPGYLMKSPFSRWLAKICLRCCYDHWRSFYKRREIPVSSITDEHNTWLENAASGLSARSYGEEARAGEIGDILECAMSKLSPKDRILIGLVYLEEMPQKEAAELLGWSVLNVRVRVHRAKRRLREIIEGMQDGDKGDE